MRRDSGESWCVVGGGALGLTLAHRLAQAGKKVTVLEAANHVGGLADGWRIGDIVWDRHYHVVLLSDLHTRGLLDDLGLGDSLRWSTTKTDFFADGRFYPLNNAFDFLRFPVLPLIDKVRLAATILYASRLTDGLALERIPVTDWLVRLSGRRTFEKIWRPLLRAKLGDNYKRASAAFIWAVVRRLYAARRSGMKTELFGYIEGGYGRVFERFVDLLDRDGVRCVTKCRVESIERTGSRLRVRSNLEEEHYDNVVVTAAAPVADRMCVGLSEPERARLRGVLYQGVVCASVLLRQPLNGCYITYITDETIPYTAVIEMSALVDRDQLGGHSLVYLPCYVDSQDPLFEEPDETIEARFTEALLAMYPGLTREDILAFRISRVRHVLAISTLHYSSKLPPMSTSVPGLHIVNSAHIVNGTLNINETVGLANAAADRLHATPAMKQSQTQEVTEEALCVSG
jgi:protoporphyrinogen oxidase